MAVFPSRPAHWVALALAVAPAYKVFERVWPGSGPAPIDREMAAAGAALFHHEWTVGDPLASSSGDGLGPVFNARSCVECHNQGGPGGGGPVEKNVTVYGLPDPDALAKAAALRCEVPPAPRVGPPIPSAGVVHQKATRPQYQEALNQVHQGLPRVTKLPLEDIVAGRGSSKTTGVQISQRNTPALFGDGMIDAVSDETIIAHQREHSAAARLAGLNGARDAAVRGRVARLVDGRIGRFGWKGEFATLNDFVKAACANEIGLTNPGRPQATPLGRPDAMPKGDDLTDEQCLQMTEFIRALPLPREVEPADEAARARVAKGKELFGAIGCTDCHSPDVGPVQGLYSDLLLHDMGNLLEASPGTYGELPVPAPQFDGDTRPNPAEWRTPPLWGVADSAPYLHDGRAATLEQAVELHGGEAAGAAKRFAALPTPDREALVAFLKTLRAPAVEAVAAK